MSKCLTEAIGNVLFVFAARFDKLSSFVCSSSKNHHPATCIRSRTPVSPVYQNSNYALSLYQNYAIKNYNFRDQYIAVCRNKLYHHWVQPSTHAAPRPKCKKSASSSRSTLSDNQTPSLSLTTCHLRSPIRLSRSTQFYRSHEQHSLHLTPRFPSNA